MGAARSKRKRERERDRTPPRQPQSAVRSRQVSIASRAREEVVYVPSVTYTYTRTDVTDRLLPQIYNPGHPCRLFFIIYTCTHIGVAYLTAREIGIATKQCVIYRHRREVSDTHVGWPGRVCNCLYLRT